MLLTGRIETRVIYCCKIPTRYKIPHITHLFIKRVDTTMSCPGLLNAFILIIKLTALAVQLLEL